MWWRRSTADILTAGVWSQTVTLGLISILFCKTWSNSEELTLYVDWLNSLLCLLKWLLAKIWSLLADTKSRIECNTNKTFPHNFCKIHFYFLCQSILLIENFSENQIFSSCLGWIQPQLIPQLFTWVTSHINFFPDGLCNTITTGVLSQTKQFMWRRVTYKKRSAISRWCCAIILKLWNH